jgi:hypothetical protein
LPTTASTSSAVFRKTRGAQQTSTGEKAIRKRNSSGSRSPRLELSTALSAGLKDELLREIAGLGAADDGALWAQRRLAAKNKLCAIDAECVEQAFKTRLASFATAPRAELSGATKLPVCRQHRGQKRHRAGGVDKSILTLPTPRRILDRDHVKSVAKQACLVCGRRPADAHHLKFAQSPALGRKVSDEFTVPLCRGHHREVHRCGDEAAWWQVVGIDASVKARALWLKSHPLSQSPSDDIVQSDSATTER